MVKIKYLKEFIVLCETLNYSKAAELLFMTQPALSRHIATLEEAMGGKLLVRDSHSVALTEAGNHAYRQFRKILQTYERVQEQTASLSKGKKGLLKISSPYYWTEDFTERAAIRFMENYPDYAIEILSCQVVDGFRDLQENRSDIFVCTKTGNLSEEIKIVPYATEPLGVLCLKESKIAKLDTISVEALQGQSLVTFKFGDDVFSDYNEFILDILAKHNVFPEKFYYADQIDTIGMVIQQTGSIAILPYGIRHMDRSYLKMIPIDDDACQMTMCLYYKTDNPNPIIPTFIKAARNEL